MRHEQLIETLGGNVAVAALCGRSPSAVSRWRSNGIPSRFWPRLVRAALRRDVPIDLETYFVGHPQRSTFRRRAG
jgi:hypothetical protein